MRNERKTQGEKYEGNNEEKKDRQTGIKRTCEIAEWEKFDQLTKVQDFKYLLLRILVSGDFE